MKRQRRLERELQKFQNDPPPGIVIESHALEPRPNEQFVEWILVLTGAPDTLYEGESYRLRVRFLPAYPMDSPEVQFLPPAPIHPHVYSNGHICLSILYDEWSPVLTIGRVCLSILSMLSSCAEKILPEDNDRYIRSAPQSSRQSRWLFHDDDV